jgi:hypothetical protein
MQTYYRLVNFFEGLHIVVAPSAFLLPLCVYTSDWARHDEQSRIDCRFTTNASFFSLLFLLVPPMEDRAEAVKKSNKNKTYCATKRKAKRWIIDLWNSLNGTTKSHEIARITNRDFSFFMDADRVNGERVNTGAKGPQVENGIKTRNTNDTR